MIENNSKIIKKIVYEFLAIILSIFFIGIIGCPIKLLTGYSCPSCGMTRAWIAFLSGDIKNAFYFHPLFLLAVPLVILIVMESFALNNKIQKFSLICISVFFILIYLLRFFGILNYLEIEKNNNGIIFLLLKCLFKGI